MIYGIAPEDFISQICKKYMHVYICAHSGDHSALRAVHV